MVDKTLKHDKGRAKKIMKMQKLVDAARAGGASKRSMIEIRDEARRQANVSGP